MLDFSCSQSPRAQETLDYILWSFISLIFISNGKKLASSSWMFPFCRWTKIDVPWNYIRPSLKVLITSVSYIASVQLSEGHWNFWRFLQTTDPVLTNARHFRYCPAMPSFTLTGESKQIGQWPVTKLTTVSKSGHLFIRGWLHKLRPGISCAYASLCPVTNHLMCPGAAKRKHLQSVSLSLSLSLSLLDMFLYIVWSFM